MTLPFRRRHNDAEATHDRARALSSRRFLEPLEGDDEAWLDRHLDACTECARDDAAYAADRELLRSLRDKPIEPPRDLWAKTSAALDIAAARRSPPAGLRNRPFWRLAPAGAVAGVAVLLVVIGASLLPGNPTVPGQGTTPPIAQASGSTPPEPTPIIITAAEIPVLRPGVGGSFDFSLTDVPAVCPQTRPECVPPPSEHAQATVPLVGLKVSTLTLAPGNDQLVYESVGGTSGEGKILIVPLKPSGTASPPPASPSASPTETAGETVVPSEPAESEGPTPEPTPTGQIEIASGVSLVGEVGYSADGAWLAFSAAPSDGSTGPDLYVYAKGGSAATKVTDDHQTYFSAWLGNRILASRVVVPVVEPAASASPEASVEPSPEASLDPGASAAPPEPIEAGSTSFVFDPATGTSQDLAQADVWMPTVDPTSRFVTYWSGTLRSTDGMTWELGEGQLVLDGWTAAEVPAPGSTDAAGASDEPTAEPTAESTPEASPATTTIFGLAGHPTPLVTSQVEDFRAKFDPEGIRLAVWVSEHADGSDGRLHLVVIDPATGTLRTDVPQPLTGVPALRRFSIDSNRLAWVTPSGQDGQESTLQILGWEGDTFGATKTEPGADLFILR